MKKLSLKFGRWEVTRQEGTYCVGTNGNVYDQFYKKPAAVAAAKRRNKNDKQGVNQ